MNLDFPVLMHEKPTLTYVRQAVGEGYRSWEVKIAMRVAIKIWLKTLLSEAQNHRCCWCGQSMTEEPGRKHSATIEHVVPKSQGGADHWDNYAAACYSCNNKRGVKSVEDFMLEAAGNVIENLPSRSKTKRTRRNMMRAAYPPAVIEEMRRYNIGFSKQPSKIAYSLDKLAVMKARDQSTTENPFEIGSRKHRLFQRYSEMDSESQELCAMHSRPTRTSNQIVNEYLIAA